MAEKTGFRRFLPNLTQSRLIAAKDRDANTYADTFKLEATPPWLHQLTQARRKLYEEPFKGVTSGGQGLEWEQHNGDG